MTNIDEYSGFRAGLELAATWLESQTGYSSRNRSEYAKGIRNLKERSTPDEQEKSSQEARPEAEEA